MKILRLNASLRLRVSVSLLMLAAFVVIGAGCSRRSGQKQGVRPRTLRDVPAQRLAYQFTADTDAPPQAADEANAILPAIQSDFDTNRKDDALLRTQLSPDRQRALVIYATGEDEPNEFRLDLYGADGHLLRHVTPGGLAVAFAPVAAWSPDGNYIAFIGNKSSKPVTAPTPYDDLMPEGIPGAPSASPSTSPNAAPLVPTFTTEQIYLCNRDGYDLKPLTSREGLIYFYLSWAPDSHALAALACRESEWRERPLSPAGRPRLLGLDGSERLLDDTLTDVLPVWSPDASKVATAFETDLRIYDALGESPSQAAIPLGDALLTASRAYDEKEAQKRKPSATSSAAPSDKPPISFNPVVNLVWPQPETLYAQTGFVRDFENEQVRNFMRWHLLRLSAQAALLN
jgi:hypothetical protein